MKKKKFTLTTTQIILLSFLCAVLLGSLLLSLPISSRTGEAVPYPDALFTADSSVCVTGLMTVSTVSTWSIFGQIVILLLIQIGGLGVITILSGVMLLLNRNFSIGGHLLIQDAFNLNTMAGLTRFIRRVLLGTALVEGTGALLYMLVFVPQFGARGIWISVFNAVSAFCNAGIDILAENSLCDYALHPLIHVVTSALVILGGLGFIVWWDILSVCGNRSLKGRKFRFLTLHTKIVLTATVILIFAGALLLFVLEYNNPRTLGELTLFDKIQAAFFQSVTTRSAGFAGIPQENLTDAGAMVSLLLMVIGGSPVGTAGGMKTVTAVVLVWAALAAVRNKRDTSLFGRSISAESIRKAVAILVMFFSIWFVSTVLLMTVCDAPMMDVIYEATAAATTVGLSRGLTSALNPLGQIILMVTMFFGRVGPISLAVALGYRSESQNVIADPTEEISIG